MRRALLARAILLLALLFLASGCDDVTYRWRLYKARNNPPCLLDHECFHKINCPRPRGYYCNYDEVRHKGVCVCLEFGGLRPEDQSKNDPGDGGFPPEDGNR
jgi:hypothetical protein